MYIQQSTALCSADVKLFLVLAIPGLHAIKPYTDHLQYVCNKKRSCSLTLISFSFMALRPIFGHLASPLPGFRDN